MNVQFEWRGIRVSIRQEGQKGRGLLLLHGWMCSAEMMSGIQMAMAPHMRTVALDFPGHGQNGRATPPPTPWGVPEYMELCAEIIRQFDLAPCDIIAHSFGARVAILLDTTYPEMVGRMILTGAAGIRRPQTEHDQKKASFYRFLQKGMNVAEKMQIFGSLPEKGREALVQRFGSPDYRALDPEMRKTFNKVISLDLTNRLRDVAAPTLLFWGANDTETPLWMGQRMETLIPDAGLVVEEGTGHYAYLEHAGVFLAVARSFLLEDRD